MKQAFLVLGLVLSITSISNAFCLKQYSRSMNRYTASFNNQAQQNNFAMTKQVTTGQSVQGAVYKQK